MTGGREKSPAAICRKIVMAQDGDEIEVWGDGEQTRSYCYIDDCVEGIYRLMRSDFRDPLNLGSLDDKCPPVSAPHRRRTGRGSGDDQRIEGRFGVGWPQHPEARTLDPRDPVEVAGEDAGERWGRVRFPHRARPASAGMDTTYRARVAIPARTGAAPALATLCVQQSTVFVARRFATRR